MYFSEALSAACGKKKDFSSPICRFYSSRLCVFFLGFFENEIILTREFEQRFFI